MFYSITDHKYYLSVCKLLTRNNLKLRPYIVYTEGCANGQTEIVFIESQIHYPHVLVNKRVRMVSQK